MQVKSKAASLTLPEEKAARGMAISWMLHKNSGRL